MWASILLLYASGQMAIRTHVAERHTMLSASRSAFLHGHGNAQSSSFDLVWQISWVAGVERTLACCSL